MEAVEEQIDVAIDLFFKGQTLASVTLAAAAERVLSDLLSNAGQQTTAHDLTPHFVKTSFEKDSHKDFLKWRNEVYDWLRHADRHPEATQEVTPGEALMWIACGITSFLKNKGRETANMQQFRRYWQTNSAVFTPPKV